MKAQILIDVLSLNPSGEVYIVDWDKRKEVNVQIDHVGRIGLYAGRPVIEEKTDGSVE